MGEEALGLVKRKTDLFKQYLVDVSSKRQASENQPKQRDDSQ